MTLTVAAISRDRVDTFENLLYVLVDGSWVFALANNFKQVFVRQEVETWENATLALKEGSQFLLDLLQTTVHFSK